MIDPRYPHTPPHVDQRRTLHIYGAGDQIFIEWPGPEGNGNGGEKYVLDVATTKHLIAALNRAVQRILQ